MPHVSEMGSNSPATSTVHSKVGPYRHPTTMQAEACVTTAPSMLCYKCNSPRRGIFGAALIVCKACEKTAVHGSCEKRDRNLNADASSAKGWICSHCSPLPGRLPVSDELKTAPARTNPRHTSLASTKHYTSAASDSSRVPRCKHKSRKTTSAFLFPVEWVEHSALPIEEPSLQVIIDEAGITVTVHSTTKPLLHFDTKSLQQIICVVNGSVCQLCLSLEGDKHVFFGLKERTDHRAILGALKSVGLGHILSKSGSEYTRVYERYLDKTYHNRDRSPEGRKQVNPARDNANNVPSPAGTDNIDVKCKLQSRSDSATAESKLPIQAKPGTLQDNCFKVISSQSFELSPPPSRSPSMERKRSMPGEFAIYSKQGKAKRGRFFSDNVHPASEPATFRLLKGSARSSDEDDEDAITLSKVMVRCPQTVVPTTVAQHRPSPNWQLQHRHLAPEASRGTRLGELSLHIGFTPSATRQNEFRPATPPTKIADQGWAKEPGYHPNNDEQTAQQTDKAARIPDLQAPAGGVTRDPNEPQNGQPEDPLTSETTALQKEGPIGFLSDRQKRASPLQQQSHERPPAQQMVVNSIPAARPSSLTSVRSIAKPDDVWKAWRTGLLSTPLSRNPYQPGPQVQPGAGSLSLDKTPPPLEDSTGIGLDDTTRASSAASSSGQVSLTMPPRQCPGPYARPSAERFGTPEIDQHRLEALSRLSSDHVVKKLNQDLTVKRRQMEENSVQVKRLQAEIRVLEDERKRKEKLHNATKDKARKDANRLVIELREQKNSYEVLRGELEEARSQLSVRGAESLLQSQLEDAAEEVAALKRQVASLELSRMEAQTHSRVNQATNVQAVNSATNTAAAPERTTTSEASTRDSENALEAIFGPRLSLPLAKAKTLVVNRTASSMLWQWGKMRAEQDIRGPDPALKKTPRQATAKVKPKNRLHIEVHVPRVRLDDHCNSASSEDENNETELVRLAASKVKVYEDMGEDSDEALGVGPSRRPPQAQNSAWTARQPRWLERDADANNDDSSDDGSESDIEVGHSSNLVTSDLARSEPVPRMNTKALELFNRHLGAPEEAYPILTGARKALSFKELDKRSKRGRRQKDTTKPSFPVGHS